MIPTSISISNFKAFGLNPGKTRLKPITLVFGPNSAGKSSLHQGLLLLDHACHTGRTNISIPRLASGPMDLGGFGQYLNAGSGTQEVIISLTFNHPNEVSDLSEELAPSGFLAEHSTTISLALGPDGARGMELEINGRLLIKARLKGNGTMGIDLIDFEHPALTSYINKNSLNMAQSEQSFLIPDLAAQMGLKPFNIMADLIKLGKFPAPGEPIPRDLAAELASLHGFNLHTPEEFLKALNEADELGRLGIVLDGILPLAMTVSKAPISTASRHTDLVYEPLATTISQHFEWLAPRIREFAANILHIPSLRELPPRTFDLNQHPDSVWASIVNDPKIRSNIDRWLGGDPAVKAPHMHCRYKVAVRDYLPTEQLKSGIAAGLDQHAHTLIDFSDPDFAADINSLTERLKDEFEGIDKLEYARAYPELWDNLLEANLDGLLTAQDYDMAASVPQGGNLINLSEEQVREQAVKLTENGLKEGDARSDAVLWSHYFKAHPELRWFIADYLNIDRASSDITTQIQEGAGTARREVVLSALPTNKLVSLQDVGFGISQILPVLAQAYGNSNRFIVVEEPESHTHPRFQAAIADAFIETALGENKNTYLIETHSEHMILRLLKRIRDSTEGDFSEWPDALRKACPRGISPDDIAVLYIQPGSDGAEIIELPVTSDGDFSRPWPSGFFTERANELY